MFSGLDTEERVEDSRLWYHKFIFICCKCMSVKIRFFMFHNVAGVWTQPRFFRLSDRIMQCTDFKTFHNIAAGYWTQPGTQRLMGNYVCLFSLCMTSTRLLLPERSAVVLAVNELALWWTLMNASQEAALGLSGRLSRPGRNSSRSSSAPCPGTESQVWFRRFKETDLQLSSEQKSWVLPWWSFVCWSWVWSCWGLVWRWFPAATGNGSFQPEDSEDWTTNNLRIHSQSQGFYFEKQSLRLSRVGRSALGGNPVKHDDSVGEISRHDEVVLHHKRSFLSVEDVPEKQTHKDEFLSEKYKNQDKDTEGRSGMLSYLILLLSPDFSLFYLWFPLFSTFLDYLVFLIFPWFFFDFHFVFYSFFLVLT